MLTIRIITDNEIERLLSRISNNHRFSSHRFVRSLISFKDIGGPFGARPCLTSRRGIKLAGTFNVLLRFQLPSVSPEPSVQVPQLPLLYPFRKVS
jgi:hypothetical protein